MSVTDIILLGILFLSMLGQGLLVSYFNDQYRETIESDGLRLILLFLASEMIMLPVSYGIGWLFFATDSFPATSILQALFHYVGKISLTAIVLESLMDFLGRF